MANQEPIRAKYYLNGNSTRTVVLATGSLNRHDEACALVSCGLLEASEPGAFHQFTKTLNDNAHRSARPTPIQTPAMALDGETRSAGV
eukprot:14274114-Alexandrium_andersonii.AAC.1